jgi:TatD DNase family protein
MFQILANFALYIFNFALIMVPYIDIHSHRGGSPEVITLRSHRLGLDCPTPAVPYSAGIHPWDAGTATDAEYDFLRHADIAAIGETGLDYLKDVDRERPREVFAAQLEIASRRGLPVIVHCVKAFADVMAMLGRYPTITALFHGYTGSCEQTAQLIKSGYYISLGEVSLKSGKTVESARNTPPARLFLETDDKPITIEQIYAEASTALNIQLDVLKEQIYNNYITLFGTK